MTGGYKIIDFKGVAFTLAKALKVEGIHESLEENTKPIMIQGLNVGGTEYDSVFAVAKKATPILINLTDLGLKITITDTDMVTIANI